MIQISFFIHFVVDFYKCTLLLWDHSDLNLISMLYPAELEGTVGFSEIPCF